MKGFCGLGVAIFFATLRADLEDFFQMYDLKGEYHEKADVLGIPKMR